MGGLASLGTYKVELDAGFYQDEFILGDYTSTATRTNLIPNPSFETNLTGSSGFNTTNSRVAATWGFGSFAYQTVATSAGTSGPFMGPLTVEPNQPYCASVYGKYISGTARSYRMAIEFYTSGGSYISSAESYYTLLSTVVQRLSVIGVAPATAASCYITVYSTTNTIGDTNQWDGWLLEKSLFLGSYFDGSYSDSYASTSRTNLIANPSFETNISNWIGSGSSSPTLLRDTAQTYFGTASLRATATGAGNSRVYAYTTDGSRIPVTAGQSYVAYAYTKAAATARTTDLLIEWYNAAGTFISTVIGTSATNSTSTWTQIPSLVAVAPATATAVQVSYRVNAVVLGEIHYFDGAIFEQATTANTYIDSAIYQRTNLLANSSFEVDTSGWASAQAGTVRSTDFAFSGVASYKITCNSLDSNIAYIPSVSVTQTTQTTISAYIYTPTGSTLAGRTIEISVEGGTAAGTIVTNSPATLVAGQWVRVSQIRNVTTVGSWVVVFRLSGSMTTASGQLLYVDAALIEQSPAVGTYFDSPFSTATPTYDRLTWAWTGVAHASTSTATWGQISTINGSQSILDTYYLDGSTNFFDVTQYVTNVSIKRGRDSQDAQFGASTCSIMIDDLLGQDKFSVANSASPYWNAERGRLGFEPRRQVKISRNGEYMFNGFIVSYDTEFGMDDHNIVIVRCADGFLNLSTTTINGFIPPAELSGARVDRILGLPEVAYPSVPAPIIATGVANLSNVAVSTQTPLAYFNTLIQEAEQGRLYIDRNGALNWESRTPQGTDASPTVIFSDDGTQISYESLEVIYE